MKLALASSLLLIGSAAAFSASLSAGVVTAPQVPTVTETYNFAKSEKIFAEAKTVSVYHFAKT